MARAQHGERRRCNDPKGKGCKQFARRESTACYQCGGGTRASQRGMVAVPPRVQDLLDGTLDVAELDDEELARGYPRAADGTFRGAPTIIPRQIHKKMVRELFDRAGAHLKENLVVAVKTMTEIAQNAENDPKVRLDASKWIVERLMGKTPDLQITVDEKRYEGVLDRMHRDAITIEVVDDGRTP